MTSSIPDLLDNLAEEIRKIKCKYNHDNNKCETCGIKYKYCRCVLKETRNSYCATPKNNRLMLV